MTSCVFAIPQLLILCDDKSMGAQLSATRIFEHSANKLNYIVSTFFSNILSLALKSEYLSKRRFSTITVV